jgi:hypothetical protein
MSKIITEDYDTKIEWGDYKIMSIDCQNNFTQFFYVIRAWCKSGESRLIDFGQLPTWSDVRSKQIEHKIKDQCVVVDSGNFATQVYKKCIEYGHEGRVSGKKIYLSWIALKGSDKYDFVHADGVKRVYSEVTAGDPNLGVGVTARSCPLYLWSNYSIKNMLIHLRDGKGVKWLSPSPPDEEYTRQLNSEMLVQEVDKKTNKLKYRWVVKSGVPNHYWDCECQQLVAATMVGCMALSS